VHINAIQERAGDFAAIALDLVGRAAADISKATLYCQGKRSHKYKVAMYRKTSLSCIGLVLTTLLYIGFDMPIRAIPKNYRNVTGISSSAKSNGESAFESTLERDFYALLEFDNKVHRYEVQPIKLTYPLEGKARTYTPDVLVEYVESAQVRTTLFEVKYRSDLKDNWSTLKPKFKAAIRYANSVGWRFRLVTELEIRTTYLNNIKFLQPFRNRVVNDAFETMLLRRIAEIRECDASTLLVAVFRDRWSQAELIPSLWRLVAIGSIGANLHQPLTMSARLWSKV